MPGAVGALRKRLNTVHSASGDLHFDSIELYAEGVRISECLHSAGPANIFPSRHRIIRPGQIVGTQQRICPVGRTRKLQRDTRMIGYGQNMEIGKWIGWV